MEKRNKLKKKILFFIGTRPELIKLYPLIYIFKKGYGFVFLRGIKL